MKSMNINNSSNLVSCDTADIIGQDLYEAINTLSTEFDVYHDELFSKSVDLFEAMSSGSDLSLLEQAQNLLDSVSHYKVENYLDIEVEVKEDLYD